MTEAQKIARNMQVLKEISTQTAESTTATSQSIAKLAQLSAAMRQSASGFRLHAVPAPFRGMGSFPVRAYAILEEKAR